jgi:hypothetical protein
MFTRSFQEIRDSNVARIKDIGAVVFVLLLNKSAIGSKQARRKLRGLGMLSWKRTIPQQVPSDQTFQARRRSHDLRTLLSLP